MSEVILIYTERGDHFGNPKFFDFNSVFGMFGSRKTDTSEEYISNF